MSVRKASVYSVKGEELKKVNLPEVFNTPYRPDVIARAVLAARSARRQMYGRDPRAGKKTSAENWGTGRGVARGPRVKGSRHPAGAKAAFTPMVVGGRLTHPPKPRSFKEKINKKERRLAIRSAIAATCDPDLVEYRGHLLEEALDIPLILDNSFVEISKTEEVKEILTTLGLLEDMRKARERTKKVRAGKGKRRGRKYKTAKTVLLVYHEDKGIFKSARNIPGIDVCRVDQLNTELLAPGTHAGRLTVWTEDAVKTLDSLFK